MSSAPREQEREHPDTDPAEVPMQRLLDWTDGSPVVRAEAPATVPHPALGLRRASTWAVAFLRPTHTHGHNIMCHADDGSGELVSPTAAALLEELVASPPFAVWLAAARARGATGVSVPRTTEDLGGLVGEVGGRWEWMHTSVAPSDRRVQGLVELDASTKGELLDFLEVHNPRTDGQPFARPGQRWLGARDEDGQLIGIGCCEQEHSGAPVLAGITVAPGARGRGLGRALTAELTRGAVAEHGWSTLGMYSHNDIARGIYLGLGYRLGARWTSGRLA